MLDKFFNISSYSKKLGWTEKDEDGDEIDASILVLGVGIGYTVFRIGADVHAIHWNLDQSLAIEWAVDRVRLEIADHEIKEQKKEAAS